MQKIEGISIRSYSLKTNGHRHPYHQLILPVKGTIEIAVDTFSGKVRVGECVVVKTGEMHYYSAESNAKFVIADLKELPDQIAHTATIVFSITPPLLYYLNFIEQQLKYQVNGHIEKLIYDTFYYLLSDQRTLRQFDRRIRNVMNYIDINLSQHLSNPLLADIACLSQTQFKKLFKEQTKLTVTEYITKSRMEKAEALLVHTDYSIQAISEIVGYTDITAFSRRFSTYFGLAPSKFRH
ncbi:helix-turn-helix domain-containing protein [Celerinatantimonas sp. YJH-8]|uniref:helix-turn-helix domain-containing protein n=1 Tax=Celerinatantimonas sp. YJH-8 TaxID=3228714 RepID=UPI0038C79D13